MKTKDQVKFETDEKIRYDDHWAKLSEEGEIKTHQREKESIERTLKYEKEKEEMEKRTHKRLMEFAKRQKEIQILQKENHITAKEVWTFKKRLTGKDIEIEGLIKDNLELMK